MRRDLRRRRIERGLAAVLCTASLWVAAPAVAALTGPITVTLDVPGGYAGFSTDPVSFSQLVTPGAGVEISAGDGSPIGANMLRASFPELIDFSGDSILLRVYAGSADGGILSTGALGTTTQHARYEFSGLQIPGQTIVGLSMGTSDGFAFSGFSGVASPASPGAYIHLVNPGSVSFDLDTLTFKDRGNGQSEAFAEFRIDLATTPVPEPSIAALLFAGLLLLGAVRRARLPMA